MKSNPEVVFYYFAASIAVSIFILAIVDMFRHKLGKRRQLICEAKIENLDMIRYYPRRDLIAMVVVSQLAVAAATAFACLFMRKKVGGFFVELDDIRYHLEYFGIIAFLVLCYVLHNIYIIRQIWKYVPRHDKP